MYLKYPSDPDRILDFSEILDENHKEGPVFSSLGCFEYEKVFHLFMLNSLASPQSTVIFNREVKRIMQRGIPTMNKFFDTLKARQEDKDRYSYEQVIRCPQKLEGHNNCLWKLIREGQLDKAIGFSKVIGFKLSRSIITIFTIEEE